MEGPRACKAEERTELLELINKTFRIPEGYSPSMGDEFELMLGEENLENMRIILEEGEPVSNVNFYKSTILVEGVPVKAASIGAVCTGSNSRGKGYSSLLLDDCERLMKEDEIRLILVSGTRSLYTRRGCALVGKCYEFTIEASESKNEDIQLCEFKEEQLPVLARIYSKESTRYYRTFKEFKGLLRGATTPWANYSYKTYVIRDSNDYCGYLVLRIINSNEGDWGSVVEAAGDRTALLKALEEAIRLNSLKYIQYFCTFNDASFDILKRQNRRLKELNLLGSVKILDFEGLMMDLMPYFSQYIDKNLLCDIKFREDNNKYVFSFINEIIEFEDVHDLTKLVFGSKDNLKRDFKDAPILRGFIEAVFPLPFVWTANLNYQ
jgi:predicted N-acetyltransferase YhbS